MTKNEKQYASRGLILFQDTVLSLLGSLMAILLVRWMSDPIPGYTILLLKWLSAALIGTILGILATKSHNNIKTYISYTSAMRTSWALVIKSGVLLLAMLTGLVKLPSISYAAMSLLADLIASIFFVLYLRFSLASLSRETQRVQDQVGKKTALVMGTGRAAVDLADESAAIPAAGIDKRLVGDCGHMPLTVSHERRQVPAAQIGIARAFMAVVELSAALADTRGAVFELQRIQSRGIDLHIVKG